MKDSTIHCAKELKIAVAQINPTVGDIDGNIERILQARKDAGEVELVVFSELALCGYIPEDLLYRQKFLQACADGIERLQKELIEDKGASILFGAPRQSKASPEELEQKLERRFERLACRAKLYNSAFLIDSSKDSHISYCDKSHLPNYGVFDEKRYFEPAKTCLPLSLQGIKLGVMLCEDFWYDDVATSLSSSAADLLIVLNASPFERDKYKHRLSRAEKIVSKTSLPLLYVNQVGGQDELVFDGGSFALSASITDKDSNIASPITMPFFEEQTTSLEYRDKQIMFADVSKLEEYDRASRDRGMDDTRAITYRAIELSIRDYVRKNGISGVVLGISGGIDSALCATLACDALGASRVEGLFMPSPYTSLESEEDSHALAKKLGFRLRVLAIDDAMGSISSIFSEGIGESYAGVAAENVQARLRGVLLMAFANHFSTSSGNFLLLSTGNKSEYATGYTTLYGDMCGGFAPLKDLYKTEVYSLCIWRNLGMGYSSENVVSTSILTKSPTAELRPNQVDEDSLPPYISLDSFLRDFLENDIIPPMQRKKINFSIQPSEHKRWQSPPGPKLGQCSFGRERRYPISNHFSEINCRNR